MGGVAVSNWGRREKLVIFGSWFWWVAGWKRFHLNATNIFPFLVKMTQCCGHGFWEMPLNMCGGPSWPGDEVVVVYCLYEGRWYWREETGVDEVHEVTNGTGRYVNVGLAGQQLGWGARW
jgi:hypothetical protein